MVNSGHEREPDPGTRVHACPELGTRPPVDWAPIRGGTCEHLFAADAKFAPLSNTCSPLSWFNLCPRGCFISRMHVIVSGHTRGCHPTLPHLDSPTPEWRPGSFR